MSLTIYSPYHTGFIEGRHIQDNIIVSQEILHNMNQMKGKHCFFIMKVNLAKAYDMLNWSLVQKVIMEIGLHDNIIQDILASITIVNMVFILKGKNIATSQLAKAFGKETMSLLSHLSCEWKNYHT